MSLTIEDITDYGNILLAYAHACKGRGHYRQVCEFEKDKVENLHRLRDDIRCGTYRTSPYMTSVINDGRKERIIHKPTEFRDRVAQWAIVLQLRPVLIDRYFSERTHAAIPGHGIHSALRQTAELVNDPSNEYCLKLDIRKYFPSIDRSILKTLVNRIVKDRVLQTILANIIDDAPGTGLPIGNLLSQFFANIYLTPFDRWLNKQTTRFVRYMDDIVIFADSKQFLRRIFRDVEWFLMSKLNLTVKSNYQIFPTLVRGVDFVGYRIYPHRIALRKSILGKLRRLNRGIHNTISTRKRAQLFAYTGWIAHCTRCDRIALYRCYIEPIQQRTDLRLPKKLMQKLWQI